MDVFNKKTGLYVPASGGLDPKDVASTEFWFDMLDTAAMYTDEAMTIPVGASTNVDVEAVEDKTGKGYNVKDQGRNKPPTWKPISFTEGLYFGGTVGLSKIAQTTEFDGADFAVFAVIKSLTSTDSFRSVISHAFNASGWSLMQKPDTNIVSAVGDGSASTVATKATTALNGVLAMVSTEYNDSANTVTLYRDGVSLGATTNNFTLGMHSADRLAIGSQASSTNLGVFWIGYIFEIVGLKNPSAQDVAGINTYLLNKHGL